MTTITLFEHEILEGADDGEIRAITQLLRGRDAKVLRPIIRRDKVCFQARQFVGVVQIGAKTIQILPKMYRSADRQQSIAEASRNLFWMLDYATEINLKKSGTANLREAQNWFEMLVRLFATNLKRQWLKGVHRSYQPIDDVLPVLKGKWRIAAQMKRPSQKHRFAVSYDTFTLDNALNRVLRYVVEKLWRLTCDRTNRKHLSDLRYSMEGITLLPAINLQSVQSIKLTRLNQQYRPLLNLAKLFLQGLGVELSTHSSPAFAFVFDMNQLFEAFITKFVQRHRQEILPSMLVNAHLLPQNKQNTVHLAFREGRGAFKLKPDLVFRNGSSYSAIIDLKYKQLNPSAHRLGISETDFYQMYAYLTRFDCPEVTLIYPQLVGMDRPVRTHFSIASSPRRIHAATIDLIQDLTTKGAHSRLIAELREILKR